MGNQRKNLLVYIGVISVIIAGFFILFDGGMARSEEIPMSSVIALTENPPIGQRVNIIVNGDELEINSGNQSYTSRKEPGSSIYQILQDAEINPANYQVEVQGSSGFGGVFSIILSFVIKTIKIPETKKHKDNIKEVRKKINKLFPLTVKLIFE